jgi:GH25 family lysozyme M1 (1,4-beta-N-acetylmuramidase)
MVLFGLDISHHQGDLPQTWFHRAKSEGIEFCIIKATEGATFVDSRFAQNLSRARAAGMLVAAYHYQRANASASAQGDLIRRVIPKFVPVIPDVEDGAGGLDHTRALIRDVERGGHRVPLIYLPQWYWEKIGKPSLAGLPPNWKSRYPDSRVGDLHAEFRDVPARFWDGFGDSRGRLATAVLQFSSSGRVAGYAPLDLNAFRGTRAELAALFGGTPVPPAKATNPPEEFMIELTAGAEQSRTLVVPKWATEIVAGRGFDGFMVHHVKFFGVPGDGPAVNELGPSVGEIWIDPARPLVRPVPAGAVNAEIFFSVDDAAPLQHAPVVGFR